MYKRCTFSKRDIINKWTIYCFWSFTTHALGSISAATQSLTQAALQYFTSLNMWCTFSVPLVFYGVAQQHESIGELLLLGAEYWLFDIDSWPFAKPHPFTYWSLISHRDENKSSFPSKWRQLIFLAEMTTVTCCSMGDWNTSATIGRFYITKKWLLNVLWPPDFSSSTILAKILNLSKTLFILNVVEIMTC